jgi:hypothetical protein
MGVTEPRWAIATHARGREQKNMGSRIFAAIGVETLALATLRAGRA